MSDWTLTHLGGDRWATVNDTGTDAVNVTIRAVGPLVVHSHRDWVEHFERIDHGRRIEFVGRAAGNNPDRPQLRLAWWPAGHEQEPQRMRVQTIDFPR